MRGRSSTTLSRLARLAIGVVALRFVAGAHAGEASLPLPPSRPAIVLPSPPDVPAAASTIIPTLPKGRDVYLPIASAEARRLGLPPEVADAVMRVESGYDPGVVGGVGERGLMQVLPSTAAMLGFSGNAEDLADPATNIRLGVRYLAGAWKLADGDLCRALMKYRAGHGEERMSPLSVEYCRRAKAHLAALGSPLGAGALPVVNFAPSGGPTVFGAPEASYGHLRIVRVHGALRRLMPVRTAAVSRRFWAAHTARVKAIEARLPWRHGGILARG